MNQQRSNRGTRRRRYDANYSDVTKMRLPGLLGVLTNPKLFVIAMVLMGGAMMLSVLPGVSTGRNRSTSSDSQVHQANELPDVAQTATAEGTPVPQSTAVPSVKRYESPPEMTIDTSRRYLATVKTSQGDFQIELNPAQAPETVNSFVFLAREGYYDNTSFMELVKNQDGSKFVAQAGDPTCKPGAFCQALGTPGYSIKKETTTLPFAKGAVGMGGTSPSSNGGQFFISFGDYPSLTGKYTIFGRVVSGMEVVDRLSLLDLTQTDAGQADTILSVAISEL